VLDWTWLEFRMGLAAASFGFLALLGSLAWLLGMGKDTAWLGVISRAVCEAVAALAELSNDVQVFTDTVAVRRAAEPSDHETRDRQRLEQMAGRTRDCGHRVDQRA
jgi:hypothetical protein